jgi:predicted metalloprotease with PDZ domain
VRGKESPLLWVLLDREIHPGDVRTLRLHYHGDLIDRFVDFFRIKSSAAWYPRSLEGRSLARFDLTFTTASNYLLASVGDRVDSTASGRSVRTRWVTPGPIRNASFNLGLFEGYEIQERDAPPVTVMVSEKAHRKLARHYVQQSKMREKVGADVSRSLKFFQQVYGPAPVRRFYATEIPDWHGEAFPGMVHLSWATFQNTSDQGDDEVFRAHEVAHQWWGIGVDFASYHDQWLSEGFSDFSGLWYLQTVSKDNDKYFDMLRRWRSSILLREGEPGPISLGHRVFASKDDDLDDYQTVVYKKGAWVVHMLRILMLDLKTMNEDRFKGMMKDFYTRYEGRRASTEDFQRVVERHVGTEMDWFFDQWVHSTAIPTYRVAHKSEPAENGQFRVRLRLRQEGVPESFQMYVPVTLDLGKDRQARLRVQVKGPLSEIELPLMPAEPKSVKFNDLEGVLAEVKTTSWD